MPISQIEPYYRTGTATFGATATVTGQGTAWLTNVEPGDQIFNRLGQMAVVSTVDSNTQITLVAPFAGTAQTAQAYTIYRVPDSVRLENFSQRMVNLLKGGNLPSIGGLTLAANKLLKAIGAGTFALQDFAPWAQNMLAKEGAANKFPYLDSENTTALAELESWARSMLALDGAANKLPYLSAANTAALTDLTAFARTVLAAASAAAARAALAEPWEPLAAGSLVGLASVPLLTLPAGYKRFNLILQGVNWGTGTPLVAQLGTASGGLHSGASDYVNSRFFTGTILEGGQFSASAAFITANVGDTIATAQWLDSDIDIYPGGTGTALVRVRSDYRNTSGNHRTMDGAARLMVGGVKDRFTAFPAGGGTTFSAGDYTLLGLRN